MKKICILIVDENTMTASPLRDVLMNKGMQAYLVSNYLELKQFFGDDSSSIDVIILNSVLSPSFLYDREKFIKNVEKGAVGLSVLDNIKEMAGRSFKNIKVIFYTTVSKEDLLEVGFSEDDLRHYFKRTEPSAVLIDTIIGRETFTMLQPIIDINHQLFLEICDKITISNLVNRKLIHNGIYGTSLEKVLSTVSIVNAENTFRYVECKLNHLNGVFTFSIVEDPQKLHRFDSEFDMAKGISEEDIARMITTARDWIVDGKKPKIEV